MQRIELKTTLTSRIVIAMFIFATLTLVALINHLVGAIAIGIALAFYVWLCVALGRRRLILDDTGVTARSVRSESHLAWDDIDHYTFWSMDSQAVYVNGGQAGAVGAVVVIAVMAAVRGLRRNKSANRRFAQGRMTLVGKNGTKLELGTFYANVGTALDVVFAELHPRLRARPGSTTDFAPFTLGDTELVHAKKGSIGLADIEKVSAGSARIYVKKRDKRLAWVNERMKQVKNVMLFLEVAAEHGLVVNANPEVFMPPTVLDKLRAAAARQSALPQARVVDRR